jgi:DNA primase
MALLEYDPVALVLSKLKEYKRCGRGYSFLCPAHPDTEQSGSVLYDDRGNAILNCFAICTRKQVCDALGITEAELYIPEYRWSRQIIYSYYDDDGNLLYEHVRSVGKNGKKNFYYRREIDGAYCWSLSKGWFEKINGTWKRVEKSSNNPEEKPRPGARWLPEVQRVPYRGELVKKAAPGSLVVIPEGEKDVETAEKMGFLASTAGSASDWKREFSDYFVGLDVIIIPDNDIAGLKCARQIALDCLGKVARLRVLQLPDLGKGSDLWDWVQAGGDRQQLLELIENAQEFTSGTTLANTTQNGSYTEDQNSHEIDISDFVEIIGLDEPISDNPQREISIRRLPDYLALLADTYATYFQLLEFEEKSNLPYMLAVTQVGKSLTCTFSAYDSNIQKKSGGIGKAASINTVKRRKERLLKEQWRHDKAVLLYQSFSYNPKTGTRPPSNYTNILLLNSLKAINQYLDENPDCNLDDAQGNGVDRKKLKVICKQYLNEFPKPNPKTTTKGKPARAKKSELEKAETRFGKAIDEYLQQMHKAGWSESEILEWLEAQIQTRLKNLSPSTDNDTEEVLI